jgi:hypothetical protein
MQVQGKKPEQEMRRKRRKIHPLTWSFRFLLVPILSPLGVVRRGLLPSGWVLSRLLLRCKKGGQISK